MPKLKEVEVKYEQIKDLILQLDFEERVKLIKEITKEKKYREYFYSYTENLARKYNIQQMSEEELDDFLQKRN